MHVTVTFEGPARAIRCALSLARRVPGELDVDIRAGLHTGEVEVGARTSGGSLSTSPPECA